MKQATWIFLKQPNGAIILAIAMNGTLVPTLGFGEPADFLMFKKDVEVAYSEFVPKTVRDALDIVEAHTAKIGEPFGQITGNPGTE